MKKGKLFLVIGVCVVVALAVGVIAMRDGGIVGDKSAGTAFAASKPATQAKPAAPKETTAERAIRTAAGKDRYVVVTFYKKGDAASDKMLATVKAMRSKVANKADFVSVDAGSSANQALIKRYQADRATIPVTLVVAPNGAITAGFQKEIKPGTDLSDAFVSDGQADVLKVLQSGKMALICLQNGKTKYNKESMTAAEGMKADKSLAGVVEIVKIDPANKAESKFLQTCKANITSANSQVVMIIPPGRILGTFDGNTTKAKLMASLQSCMSSCGAGCGPSGCGPTK